VKRPLRRSDPLADAQELCHLWLLLERAALLEPIADPETALDRPATARTRSPEALVERHLGFHLALGASAGNPHLDVLLGELLRDLRPHLVAVASRAPSLLDDGALDEALLAAVRDPARRAEGARLLEAHVSRVAAAIAPALPQQAARAVGDLV